MTPVGAGAAFSSINDPDGTSSDSAWRGERPPSPARRARRDPRPALETSGMVDDRSRSPNVNYRRSRLRCRGHRGRRLRQCIEQFNSRDVFGISAGGGAATHVGEW